jgi:PAS domain S-box-containing protein
MPIKIVSEVAKSPLKTLALRWSTWWRNQTPSRQDTFALIAPLTAVVFFFIAVAFAFGYLRYEEILREEETVRRDVEYVQERLRVRLLERQEQIMRLSRDLASQDIQEVDFIKEAGAVLNQYPEISSISWLDIKKNVRYSFTATGIQNKQSYLIGNLLSSDSLRATFDWVKSNKQLAYAPLTFPSDSTDEVPLQLFVPYTKKGFFQGVFLVDYKISGLLRFVVPQDILTRHAVSIWHGKNQLLAGNVIPTRTRAAYLAPFVKPVYEYSVPISPVGAGLILKAQAYRTSQGVIGNGLFWLVTLMSLLTAWMLIGTWRHTRRRLQAQRALVAETNFRRAMENSILTGMRAMDMQGCITYVNAAFCQMTGWSEAELVGQYPPFPYWPDADRELLSVKLAEELSGQTSQTGLQVRVKKKDGTIFDARLYVSPLVDAKGLQSGWMTSMTDITEPNRIRQQLSASYERFTTVLEALDASVSVTPIGSSEILFTNKLYRQWFGIKSDGHLQMIDQAFESMQITNSLTEDSDDLAGLPSQNLERTMSENAEVFMPGLSKWLEVRSRYLNWVDGRLAQMIIATDITPRRHAEEQSAIQAERAQSVSRLITMGEMASSVAHELNQPLTAINNYCTGLLTRIKTKQLKEEDLQTALEKTAHQAQRAGQIIQRIRGFVKRSEPNRNLANIGMIVMEAVELAEIEFKRRQVRLSHYISAHLPAVMVDPILIEQVLVNLLRNAAESIDLGKRQPNYRQVDLKVLPKVIDDQVAIEFSVTDTGKGLAPEVLERLYEAFFSTKTEGMGMGLNLCRSIVESHQGRMKAENLYNGEQIVGCRFSFWLPAHSEAVAP